MPERPNRSGESGGGVRGTLSYWLWRRWHGPDQGDHGMPSEKRGTKAVRQESMERGHEPEEADESIGGILGSAVLLVVSVAVVIGGLYLFFAFLGERGPAPAPQPEITTADASISDGPPKPRLQVDPAIDLQDMHRREYERLHTYGRVDSARLHIPIDRAMQLLARRGLPADSATVDSADVIRIPTGNGFRTASRRFPGSPTSDPFLGSSPEPYTPAPALRRRLTEGGYLPGRTRTDSTR